jgi:hypothetical protein
MRHTILVGLLVLPLVGCMSGVEKISGTEDTVTVRAEKYGNPRETAAGHCAQYGKDPELVEVIDQPSELEVGRRIIYKFRCR